MAKKDSYTQVWSGEWMDFDYKFDLSCCDCGLVHEIDLRLHEGKIQVKMTENKPETKKRRRRLKLTIE